MSSVLRKRWMRRTGSGAGGRCPDSYGVRSSLIIDRKYSTGVTRSTVPPEHPRAKASNPRSRTQPVIAFDRLRQRVIRSDSASICRRSATARAPTNDLCEKHAHRPSAAPDEGSIFLVTGATHERLPMRFLQPLLGLFGAADRFALAREAEFRAMFARADALPVPKRVARLRSSGMTTYFRRLCRW